VWETILLSFFAFLAGFVDSIVGGGGLIQLPALLIWLPGASAGAIAPIFGTNKFAAVFGTGSAAVQYTRKIQLGWEILLPGAVSAFIFSALGAMAVSLLTVAMMKPAVVLALAAVAVFTYTKKDFGRFANSPGFSKNKATLLAIVTGMVVGFYDGFFGPGTGSFLIFIFVAVFGFDFLRASASAKIINFATNLSAVAYFTATGNVMFQYAIPMAICQLAGGFLGSRLAILKGNHFIRRFFLAIVVILLIRLCYDLVA